MKLKIQKPKEALNKAYLKQKVNRDDFEPFKANLITLLKMIDEKKREKNIKIY